MSFGDPWFYIVLVGVAALVYGMMLPGRRATGNRVHTGSDELEATLEQYMLEIEKENGELIDLVAQMKQDLTSRQLAHQEQITELRQRLIEVEHNARNTASRLERLEELPKSSTIYQTTDADSIKAKPTVEASEPAKGQAELIPTLPVTDAATQESVEDTDSVRDRYPELFELYEKGKSIDTIAKSIGLQRGEIQLILQLAKREESR